MPDDENLELSERLKRIESHVSELEAKVRALESERGAVPRFQIKDSPPSPPPVMRQPPVVSATPPLPPTPPPTPVSYQMEQPVVLHDPKPPIKFSDPPVAPPAAATPKPRDANAVEYQIGGQVMPRIGAAVFVIGILFLVAMAISRGLITPRVQFIGELVLAAGFVLVGLWKRNEREDFGQLLIGIGSCGLFASFAGAQVVKHLISGETLVILFTILSILNLAFAWWRASISFLALGMMGGFAAALLPLRENHVALNLALHFLILVPSALIAWRHRWVGMALLVWIVGVAALIPALDSSFSLYPKFALVFAASLIGMTTYAALAKNATGDSKGVMLPIGLVSTSLLGFSGSHPLSSTGGIGMTLALGAVAIAISFIPKLESQSKNMIRLGAALVVLCVAPFAATPIQAAFVYATLASACAIVAKFLVPKVASSLAWTEIVLGFCACMLAVAGPDGNSYVPILWTTECWLLTSYMVAIGLAAWTSPKETLQTEAAIVIGALLTAPLFARFGFLVLDRPPFSFGPEAAVIVALFAYAVIFSLASYSSKRIVPLGVAVVSVVGAAWLYIQVQSTYATPGIPYERDVFFVVALIAMAAFLGTEFRRRNAINADGAFVLAGLPIGALFVRLGYLVVHNQNPAAIPSLVVISFGLAYSVLASIVSLRWKTKGAALVASAFAAGAVFFDFVQLMNGLSVSTQYGYGKATWRIPWEQDALMVGGLIVTTLLALRAASQKISDSAGVIGFGIVALWYLASREGYVLLTSPGVGMQEPASISVAWTIFGIALISIGFWKRRQILRYWSFAVFGLTLAKVFVYDMANLDAAVRVIVFMALGMALIGGGYAYIRFRKTEEAKPEQSP